MKRNEGHSIPHLPVGGHACSLSTGLWVAVGAYARMRGARIAIHSDSASSACEGSVVTNPLVVAFGPEMSAQMSHSLPPPPPPPGSRKPNYLDCPRIVTEVPSALVSPGEAQLSWGHYMREGASLHTRR